MSTYPLKELLRFWEQERLSTEQAVGHLLQHARPQTLSQHLQELERHIQQLEARLPSTRER